MVNEVIQLPRIFFHQHKAKAEILIDQKLVLVWIDLELTIIPDSQQHKLNKVIVTVQWQGTQQLLKVRIPASLEIIYAL